MIVFQIRGDALVNNIVNERRKMKSRNDYRAIFEKHENDVDKAFNDLYKAIREDVNVEIDKRDELISAKEKEIEEKYKAKYEGYVSKEDFDKVNSKVTELENANAKASRVAKYLEKGINQDAYDFVDSKLANEKDFDKALESFVKEEKNAYLLTKKEAPKEEKNGFFNFGGSSNEGSKGAKVVNNGAPTMGNALKEYYASQFQNK